MIADDVVGMGGPEGRVYWPPGMEEWLRPKKREVKKKDPANAKATPAAKDISNGAANEGPEVAPKSNAKAVKASAKKGRAKKAAAPPSVLSDESEGVDLDEEDKDAPLKPVKLSRAPSGPRATSRKGRKSVNYNEDDAEMEEA
jgi:UV DNA damage endonuclease